ncbi:MAG: hypothetical protein M3Y53_07705 [Thermoproteota archaeon]|nr:hypothetical protein [Thermoproteota archaeon]
MFKLLDIFFRIGETQNSSCDSSIHAYKNGKTMEQCSGSKEKYSVIVRRNLKHGGEISSKRVLQVTDYDELVYKLTLKYLQKGYDISNNTIPHVKNT